MSSHFQCRCGALFHANEAIKHKETGEGYFLLCPHCESEDLEDAWLCEVCGVRKADVEGSDMCSVCARAEDELLREPPAELDSYIENLSERGSER